MAFASFDDKRANAPMAEINMVPLIDVMLVLLVIFILSAPLFTNAVKLELPKAQAAAAPKPASAITLSIDGAGAIFWDDAPVTTAELEERLTRAAGEAPQPELQLRADKDTRYEAVAQVMAAAQSRGLTKLGFVTDPTRKKN